MDGDRRPLGSRFQDTCRQTRGGGGLPETEDEGEVGGIPSGITHDLVLQFDLPARKMEREERLLAMHGGDVNETLWDICVEGGGKDARFLLAHGADANHRRDAREPAICHAARNGHVTVVEALVDAGANFRDLAFASAAHGGHTAVVAMLLDRGVDVHYADEVALYWAACFGDLETATLLLQRGANIMLSRRYAASLPLRWSADTPPSPTCCARTEPSRPSIHSRITHSPSSPALAPPSLRTAWCPGRTQTCAATPAAPAPGSASWSAWSGTPTCTATRRPALTASRRTAAPPARRC